MTDPGPRTVGALAPKRPPLTWWERQAAMGPDRGAFGISRRRLERAAQSNEKRQETVAAQGATLPVVYGRVRLGAKIAGVVVDASRTLWVLAVWCEGPVEAIESVQADNEVLRFGVQATHYLGTDSQTVDSNLVAAYADNGITFTDALPYTCYSVVKVPFNSLDHFPRLAAVIQGLKVYDPRSTLTTYSTNPALQLADYITSTRYGMAADVDWPSVETAADFCDEVLSGTEARRLCSVSFDRMDDAAVWRDMLAAYAGVFFRGNDPYVLVPDEPASSVITFDDSNIVEGSMRLKKRGGLQVPTVLSLTYTDTTTNPWRNQIVRVYASGVLAGTAPWRESKVSLTGITRYSQALREATERLNKLTLTDLHAEWTTFDAGVRAERGDVVTVTHPMGLTAKRMRVASVQDVGFGRYKIAAEEYDPAVYSAVVVNSPTYPDTSLGNPLDVPKVTGLSVSEDVYYIASGYYASRLVVTWDEVTWQFLAGYRVEVWDGSTLVQSDTVQSGAYTTPPVQEGRSYDIYVAAFSYAAMGDEAQESLIVTGKNTAPGNVTSVSAVTVGGMVSVQWTAASDLDLTAHEVRYWSGGGSWDTGTLVDRVAMPATRYITPAIPPGTWTVGVKGLDSVRNAIYPYGQPSATAATATITVEANGAFSNVRENNFSTPTLTNMAERTAGGVKYWITDLGATWNSLFTTTMSTYTLPVAAYHSTATASLVTESYDFGAALSGTFVGSMTYTVLNGAASFYLELSIDASTWVQYPGGAANTTARYARLRITHSGAADAVRVDALGKVVLMQAVRRETFTNQTSLASGGKRIQLVGTYGVASGVLVSPVGSAQRSASVGNVLVAPTHGLLLSATMSGGGNCYIYRRISNASYTFASGDYVEYEVYVFNSANTSVGGLEMDFTDYTAGRYYGWPDSYGPYVAPSIPLPRGQWVARKSQVAAGMVGKTVNSWDLVHEDNTAGHVAAVYRNIRVTDGGSTTHLTVYGSSGEPDANATAYSLLVTDVRCGPANSFEVYLWNGATQVADLFNASFDGV